MNKTEVQSAELTLLKSEWRSGAILNPFWLINDCVTNLSPGIVWEGKTRKQEKIEEICGKIAEVFLDCTSYRVTAYGSAREWEKAFITAMFLYLYCEAPAEEQNMAIIAMLIRADMPGHSSSETDLQRLFDLLAEKDDNHDAIKHFKVYLESPAGRVNTVKSLSKRFCPLFSFQKSTNDAINIFEHCRTDEIFEMSVALLHNCLDEPQTCNSLEKHTDEIAFVVAVMHFMHDILPAEEKTAETLFKFLNKPSEFDIQINETHSSDALKYWKLCRKNILKDKYDKGIIRGISEFYCAFE